MALDIRNSNGLGEFVPKLVNQKLSKDKHAKSFPQRPKTFLFH